MRIAAVHKFISNRFWVKKSERQPIEKRYSPFVPIPAGQVSPERPVSQISVLRSGLWRPHPTGHLQSLRSLAQNDHSGGPAPESLLPDATAPSLWRHAARAGNVA